MDPHEQEEAVLQKIADTKDNDALYSAADETTEGGDPYHDTLDGIHAGLGKSKKRVWSVEIRDGIDYEVVGVTTNDTDRNKLARQIKAIVPWVFKHSTIKDFLKNQLKPKYWTHLGRLSQEESQAIEALFKEYGLTQVESREENNFNEAYYAFFIDTSFDKVKKRLEALPDRKVGVV